MSCEQLDRLSLWMDGELAGDAEREFAAHLASCEVCRAARHDFLRIRGELQTAEPVVDPATRLRVLQTILDGKRRPAWVKPVPVPAPLLAALVLACVWLAWIAGVRGSGSASPPPQPTRITTADSGAADLSRYDRGRRAVLIKVPGASASAKVTP